MRLAMWVLDDEVKREYAYGAVKGLLATRVGGFTRAPYDEAKKRGSTVISMKNELETEFRLSDGKTVSSQTPTKAIERNESPAVADCKR